MITRTEDYRFYLARVDVSESGVMSLSSEGYVDLESYFPCLRYQKCVGINSVGNTRHYEEKFAERDDVRRIESTGRDPVSMTLTVVFIDPGKAVHPREEQIRVVESEWSRFVSFVSSRRLIYADTVRGKKFLGTQVGELKPKSEGLKPYPHYVVELKLTSLYGTPSIPISATYNDASACGFVSDDTPIE